MDEKIDYSKIYSPSKLNMFSQCPKEYHFTYLDPTYSQMKNELKRLPENIWSFQTLGKAVHNAITLFYHSSPEQRTKEQLKKYLFAAWLSEIQWNQKPPLGEWGGFKNIEEERTTYNQAWQMLENFLKTAERKPDIEYLPTDNFRRSIDDYVSLIIPLNEDFDISGKFDLVVRDNDNSLCIIDFKTGKKEDSDSFQLKFYKVLAEENFKKPVRKASFYFLAAGHKKEFDLEEQTKAIKEEIVEKINQIKATKNFTPKPSKLCKFCLFQTFCPEKEEVKKILKEAKGEDYADDLPF